MTMPKTRGSLTTPATAEELERWHNVGRSTRNLIDQLVIRARMAEEEGEYTFAGLLAEAAARLFAQQNQIEELELNDRDVW